MAGRVARGLSELEGCVLGLVWKEGPLTPYAVRRELRESPNPHWGQSAGSIYPVFRRLEEAGLVASAVHATGARRALRYRITARGRNALRRWIGPPVGALAASLPPDPLRTRMTFLDALEPHERAAFLAAAEKRITAQIERAERYRAKAAADPFRRLVSDGAMAMMRTRRDWIRGARRAGASGRRR